MRTYAVCKSSKSIFSKTKPSLKKINFTISTHFFTSIHFTRDCVTFPNGFYGFYPFFGKAHTKFRNWLSQKRWVVCKNFILHFLLIFPWEVTIFRFIWHITTYPVYLLKLVLKIYIQMSFITLEFFKLLLDLKLVNIGAIYHLFLLLKQSISNTIGWIIKMEFLLEVSILWFISHLKETCKCRNSTGIYNILSHTFNVAEFIWRTWKCSFQNNTYTF